MVQRDQISDYALLLFKLILNCKTERNCKLLWKVYRLLFFVWERHLFVEFLMEEF